MSPAVSKDDVKIPEGWHWVSEWEVDMDEPGDTNGIFFKLRELL